VEARANLFEAELVLISLVKGALLKFYLKDNLSYRPGI
jgi:hypothetical protein